MLTMSKAFKLAGFKGRMEVSALADVPVRTMQDDFSTRLRPFAKPKIYNHLRRALDKKHMIERGIMEAAINKMKEKEGQRWILKTQKKL